MPRYPVTSYNSAVAYILNDNVAGEDRDEELAEMLDEPNNFTEHGIKCKMMRNFFTKNTNCEVRSVIPSHQNTQAEFSRYWDEELQGKGGGDLIILYYHGNAGYNGVFYAW